MKFLSSVSDLLNYDQYRDFKMIMFSKKNLRYVPVVNKKKWN